MHQESGLLMGHLQRVIDRPGHRAGDHAAKRAGGEYREPQEPGEQVRAPLGADDALALHHHMDEALNAAGTLHQVDHRAHNEAGGDDDHIAAGHGIHDGIQPGADADQGRKRR